MFFSRYKLNFFFLCLLTVITSLPNHVESAKKSQSAKIPPPPPPEPEIEPVIEEVTAKQLERILQDKDFVAVYWCK